MLPNEYLYFYYYRERALANIQAASETRGQQVQRLSTQLVRDLADIDPAAQPERAWDRYQQYQNERRGTYLAMESGSETTEDSSEHSETDQGDAGEGYGGVALDILTAATGHPSELVVNVPNEGAIPGMRDDDVVEVACRCDDRGIRPIPLDAIPEDQLLLMQAVKRYELLTVEAVTTRSRALAVEALLVHPLIGSYSLARGLVTAYLEEHRAYVGEWND
jgi:6-phospho-beta-glucosidase